MVVLVWMRFRPFVTVILVETLDPCVPMLYDVRSFNLTDILNGCFRSVLHITLLIRMETALIVTNQLQIDMDMSTKK